MLEETPNPALLLWWRWYCRHALRKHFHRVMLYGDWPAASKANNAAGTLYLCNHLSFWDGIVLFEVLRCRLGESALRCMIDETQVRKHRFFRSVGGFSVNRASPRDGLRAVQHAAELLGRGHGVVVFPQGGIRPAEAPFALERGFTYILDRAANAAAGGTRLQIIVLRYEFWEDQRPEVLIWSGGLLTPGATAHAGMEDVLGLFRRGFAELREASLNRRVGEVFLTGRRSIAEWGFRRAGAGQVLINAGAPPGGPAHGTEPPARG